MRKPLLSAIITVFNGEEYLAEAIQSLLSQTFKDFELIIVNDGSTDGTAKIIQRYAAGDSRIRFIDLSRVGRVGALNIGCRQAQGEYIAIMDADDISLPHRFEYQIDFLRKNVGVALLGTGVQKVDKDGRSFATVIFPLNCEEIRERLKSQGCFAHSTVVMAKDAVLAVGGYRKAFPPAEDYDLWLRLAENYEVANLPQALVMYRVHPDQISSIKLEQHTLSVLGARIAARLRLENGIDPTDNLEQISLEFLEQSGISREEINRSIVSAYLSTSLTIWMCGAHDRSIGLLEKALAWAQAVNCDRATSAPIHTLLGTRYIRQGKLVKGLASLVQSYRENPAETKAFITRGWSKVRDSILTTV
jgi:glycosyltransferase involved in cell wall biosynthesis